MTFEERYFQVLKKALKIEDVKETPKKKRGRKKKTEKALDE